MLTLSSILVILPGAFAQAPTMKSYPFIGATPNPVTVNQPVLFHVGISQQLSIYWMGWEDLSMVLRYTRSITFDDCLEHYKAVQGD